MRASALQWESWARLMRKVQEGDEEAYRTLLREIGPLLYSFVRKRVFNPAFVDDVYQEVLFTLHRARHTYKTERPFAPWLFTVAHNAFLDAIGRNRKFAEREVPVEALPEGVGRETEDPGLGDELHLALAELPENLRRAVVLLKIEGLTLEEAALEMGLRVGAVKVRAHRGYARLRRILLEKRGKNGPAKRGGSKG